MQNESKVIQENSVKAKPKVKRSKTFLVEGLTGKAKKNITVQQSAYMKQTGKKLPKSKIAGILLETATL